MFSEENYKEFFINKIPIIMQFAGNRKIWIYGAGTCGKIVMKTLIEYHIQVSGFIDTNAEKIKNVDNYPVQSILGMNPKEDFIIVSLHRYDNTIIEICEEKGYTKKDYYYISVGENFNKEDIIYKGCKIGRYTYGYENLLQYKPLAESIGRFCSINCSAKIWDNHPMDYVTTHPLLDNIHIYAWEEIEKREQLIKKYGKYNENAAFEASALRDNRPVVIGNDVWIGANVIILPGIHIGDGAVLAAGAVVTKNIDDYAIVGGVPAKVIRYRFQKEDIIKFQKLQWWNWEIEKIMDNLELFYQPEKFLRMYA